MNKAELKEILKIPLIATSPLLFLTLMDGSFKFIFGSLAFFSYMTLRSLVTHFQQVNKATPDYSNNNVSDDDSSSIHASHIPQNMINPSTGLPMIGGMGGTDLHGNFYGSTLSESSSWTSSSHDSQTLINPASSLPMMGGIGGTDLHGNFYGSNTNNW